ncbi:hypothetical protein [Pedobacter sp. P26]
MVTLRAFTNNGCVDIFTLNNLVVLDGSTLQIPNSFLLTEMALTTC